jgi:hypothetical protein
VTGAITPIISSRTAINTRRQPGAKEHRYLKLTALAIGWFGLSGAGIPGTVY